MLATVNDGGLAFEHMRANRSGSISRSTRELTMTVLQWGESFLSGKTSTVEGARQLRSCAPADLTVIFADLDLWSREWSQDMEILFKQFDLPDAFVAERLDSVTYSFGYAEAGNSVRYFWLHSLCKNVEIDSRSKLRTMHSPRGKTITPQADYSWHCSSYICKAEPKVQQSSGQPGQGNGGVSSEKVTLFCFGAPRHELLQRRFEYFNRLERWRQAINDPFSLFHFVFDQLYQQLDETAWRLSKAFGNMEHTILSRAHNSEYGEEVNFAELHNVAKTIIYLNEGADAIISTVDSMLASHNVVTHRQPSGSTATTIHGLQYRKGLFHSTQLRLKSLEKRMTNILNLSFNLIAQHDNRIVQRDSKSMKTVAMVTLFFLPTTTVATIFGTSFFEFSESADGKTHYRVSPKIWLLGAISTLLTLLVLAAHLWWITGKPVKVTVGRKGWLRKAIAGGSVA